MRRGNTCDNSWAAPQLTSIAPRIKKEGGAVRRLGALPQDEPMFSRFFVAAFILSCFLTAVPAPIQAQAAQSAPQQPGYTFKTGTNIVLTDVTVTDARGNPVHGLKDADFHIFDNKKPQTILSFEEHTTSPVAYVPQASTAPGVYSNSFLRHLPPVLNIIVIDTTNIPIVDQMYLNYELTRFIRQLPPDEPLAVYWRNGPASILLQNFTSDRTLLLAAVHKAIPRFPPIGREYYSDLATLNKIMVDFGQYPGRKNVLWFTGGSTLFLRPDPAAFVDQREWREIYDEIETSRIAIYPIDARGLTVIEGYGMFAQHALMNDIAEATGGHAYYNNNGFDQIAAHWLSNGGSFYTLTYSPSGLKLNNKWHKVQIKLDTDGPKYYLSYRRGYSADGSISGREPSGGRRTHLLANGSTVSEPDLRSQPIIFQAHVVPSSEATGVGPLLPALQTKPKKGTTPYSIRYLLPAGAFTTNVTDGKTQIVLGVAVIAFNEDGSKETSLADRATFTVNPDQLRTEPNLLIPVNQQVNLRKGQTYLYFAVWDMTSGRLGTLQVPLQVGAPKKIR
jgi:VWFA-related protein